LPEGDTIFRTASRLQQALAGKRVTRFETVLPQLARVDDQSPLRGRTIEQVVARGKHLIIDFSGDLHLRTHMRMSGEWHLYRHGERWWRPRRDMRIVIETDDFVAVGFAIPVAEFSVDALRHLGPDFLADDFDVAEAMRRARSMESDEIGNVLLNQRVAAGVGNIWKSETLFRCGVDPFRHVGEIDDATLERIVKAARALLRKSATSGAEKQVYGRRGEPCRKCGTAIRYAKQGTDARGTYWCPRCQG
jgi:endonuclease-8